MPGYLFLLIVALLFKGLPVAYALPTAGAAAHAEHQMTCANAGDCAEHGAYEHRGHHDEHASDKACQIACDLSAAPAICTASGASTCDAPRVEVATLPALALSAAPPPDHPPPIC